MSLISGELRDKPVHGSDENAPLHSPKSAVNQPTSFREIYQANVPSDQSHWHYNVDREVKLDEPARTLFVRYVGEPAVNNIRIFAHCLEDRPLPSAPVLLTHEWSENGVRRSKQVRLEAPGEYDIEAGADPVDESIEMAIASGIQ